MQRRPPLPIELLTMLAANYLTDSEVLALVEASRDTTPETSPFHLASEALLACNSHYHAQRLVAALPRPTLSQATTPELARWLTVAAGEWSRAVPDRH